MSYTLADHHRSMAEDAILRWVEYLKKNNLVFGCLGDHDQLVEEIMKVLKNEVECVKSHMNSDDKSLNGVHGQVEYW